MPAKHKPPPKPEPKATPEPSSTPKKKAFKPPRPPFTDKNFVKPPPAAEANPKPLHEMLARDMEAINSTISLDKTDLAHLQDIARAIGPNVSLEEAVRHLIHESPLHRKDS